MQGKNIWGYNCSNNHFLAESQGDIDACRADNKPDGLVVGYCCSVCGNDSLVPVLLQDNRTEEQKNSDRAEIAAAEASSAMGHRYLIP